MLISPYEEDEKFRISEELGDLRDLVIECSTVQRKESKKKREKVL